MQTQNTTENIFRFVHVRGPAQPGENEGLQLSGETRLAGQLLNAQPPERQRLASGFLDRFSGAPFDAEDAKTLLSNTKATLDRDGTAGELRDTSNIAEQVLRALHRDASDVLLAGKFAGRASEHAAKADHIFRASGVLLGPTADFSKKLRAHFRRPLSLPPNFRPAIAPRDPAASPRVRPGVTPLWWTGFDYAAAGASA